MDQDIKVEETSTSIDIDQPLLSIPIFDDFDLPSAEPIPSQELNDIFVTGGCPTGCDCEDGEPWTIEELNPLHQCADTDDGI